MYLELKHGRRDPHEDMDEEEGFNGPIIGPVIGVGATYNAHLKVILENDKLSKEVVFFPVYDGMVVWEGREETTYYGVWQTLPDLYADEQKERLAYNARSTRKLPAGHPSPALEGWKPPERDDKQSTNLHRLYSSNSNDADRLIEALHTRQGKTHE